jgi:CrcB protein
VSGGRAGARLLAVLALVAIGGVVGAAARHAIAELVDSGPIPWGTLIANVVGSLALGVVVAMASRHEREPWWYPLIGIGALGAMTTMSTFQVEVVLMLDEGRFVAAAGYVALTLVLGLAAGWLGLSLARPRRAVT